jgi:hypothetical protein
MAASIEMVTTLRASTCTI